MTKRYRNGCSPEYHRQYYLRNIERLRKYQREYKKSKRIPTIWKRREKIPVFKRQIWRDAISRQHIQHSSPERAAQLINDVLSGKRIYV